VWCDIVRCHKYVSITGSYLKQNFVVPTEYICVFLTLELTSGVLFFTADVALNDKRLANCASLHP
jgi:hypothetical protein